MMNTRIDVRKITGIKKTQPSQLHLKGHLYEKQNSVIVFNSIVTTGTKDGVTYF